MFAKEIYTERRAQLMKQVGHGLIILPGNFELPYNYGSNTLPFRQDSTFLYYIGVDEPNLLAILDCDSGKEYIFGNDLTIDDIIWTGQLPSLAEKAEMSGIQNPLQWSSLEGEFSQLLRKGNTHYIYPYQASVAVLLSQLLGIAIDQLKANQSIELIKAAISMRRVKSHAELQDMEQAVNVTASMHRRAMRLVASALKNESAISERDVMGEISRTACSGGYYHSFPPIVTIHGEVFHNHGYKENLRKGSLLLVDAGAESLNHYAGDMTRTIPVSGKFSKRQKDIYDIVVRANEAVIQSAKPGMLWRDMHDRAARTITSGLKDLGLMKGDTDDIVESGAYALFFPHGLGHLVGLDVHDMENYGEDLVGYSDTIHRSKLFGPSALRYALALEPNMVITDEPGIYFVPQLIDLWKKENRFADMINYDRVEKYKGFGGIRIEDDLLITESGCRVMGSPVPKTSADVEQYIEKSMNL